MNSLRTSFPYGLESRRKFFFFFFFKRWFNSKRKHECSWELPSPFLGLDSVSLPRTLHTSGPVIEGSRPDPWEEEAVPGRYFGGMLHFGRCFLLSYPGVELLQGNEHILLIFKYLSNDYL